MFLQVLLCRYLSVTRHLNPLPFMTHDKIQSEIYKYSWNKYPETRRCMWHTPNELIPDNSVFSDIKKVFGWDTEKQEPSWFRNLQFQFKKRFSIFISQRKAVGVLSGVTDLVIYRNGILYMMDVKIGRDKLSDNQKLFIKAIERQGGEFREINSIEQGFEFIDYIHGK